MKRIAISILEKIIKILNFPKKLVIQENPEYNVTPWGELGSHLSKKVSMKDMQNLVYLILGRDYSIKMGTHAIAEIDIYDKEGNVTIEKRNIYDKNSLIISNKDNNFTIPYPNSIENFRDSLQLITGTSDMVFNLI